MSEKITFNPDTLLNGVRLSFSPESNAGVLPVLHLYLNKLLDARLKDINEDKFYTLFSLHISSTSEPYFAHKEGGPHRRGLAIDIAAINGLSITKNYNISPEVTGICNALQYKAIDIPETWENFGPLLCLETMPDGRTFSIPPNNEKRTKLINLHKTHLHFSVRG